MKWEDLDFSNKMWTIPKTKNGSIHEVHLSEPMMKILDSLPRVEKNPYVFVGEKAGQHYGAIGKVWRRIRSKVDLEKYTVHDIRRTMGSYLAQDDVPRDRIGQILNHKDKSVTGIYARLTYRDKVKTWDRLAEILCEIIDKDALESISSVTVAKS